MIDNYLPPIFTPDERDQNEARKKELTDLILSEQAVLVVGAGSSVMSGYPDWSKLLDKFEQLAENCGNDFQRDEVEKEDDPLDYVEKIKKHFRERDGDLNKYNKEITRLFSPKSKGPHFTEFHKKLVQLPFKGILTTNYDTVLECALGAAYSPDDYIGKAPLTVNKDNPTHVSNFFLSLDSNRLPKQVLHLHGLYSVPSQIIQSKNDYIEFYGLKPEEKSEIFKETSSSWSLHRKVLWSILATRLSVWVGFSMTDPYLNEMLKMVNNDLWRWDETIHFAVMSINKDNADENKKKAELLKREYGMGVVFYESTDTDHSGLKQYIESIYERYKRKQNQSEKSNSGKEHESQMKDIIPSMPQNLGKKKSSDWLDRVNQIMEERVKVDGN